MRGEGRRRAPTSALLLPPCFPGPGARYLDLQGRVAWALSQLHAAGEQGCTPIDTPGPRWSHYVYMLRREGIAVETVHETHGGTFSGHHARYVLRTPVAVEPVEVAK